MDTLYDAALRLTGDRAAAQDLTQETMLRALRSFQTFKPGTNCKAWLLRIQYNLFCTQYRKNRRLPLVWLDSSEEPSVEPASFEPGPEEQAVREMDRESVRRAIALLPEDFRVAVTLVDIHGLSCAEAATVMGVPRGTILSRLHRARRRLERLLTPELGRVQADDL
jgi:RNA polymerase sigma-70 factor (ECF subfamily)